MNKANVATVSLQSNTISYYKMTMKTLGDCVAFKTIQYEKACCKTWAKARQN